MLLLHSVDCPTNLLAKERRFCLTPAEKHSLQLHLGKCDTCRALRQLGRDFDAEATVLSQDEATIDQIAIRLQTEATRNHKQTTSLRRQHRRKVAWGGGAAASFVVSAAAAYVGFSSAFPPTDVAPSLSTSITAKPASVSNDAARVRPSAPTAPTVPQTHTTPTAILPATTHATAAVGRRLQDKSASGPASPKPIASAIDLYRSANQARRSGQAPKAVALFRNLLAHYPNSEEAKLARVPLGTTLLESGRHRDALRQFDQYLTAGGSLAPEALFGRASALARLGNRSEQRRAWLRLLEQYPRSPYALTARRQLDQLE